MDLYDTAVNVERVMKERVTLSTSSGELRGRGITEETSNRMSSTIDLLGISTETIMLVEASTPMHDLR